jgi:hypothetical protein
MMVAKAKRKRDGKREKELRDKEIINRKRATR